MFCAKSDQVGFFDAADLCDQVVPADSFYGLLRDHGDRLVCDEDFADCYSPGRGRPSIPPSLLSKVLLLAFYAGVGDEGAMDCVRFDLRWKSALGLPVDHQGFHATTLVKFRARLLLHNKERLVFERTLDTAKELGLLAGCTEQIMDSTPMLGAAASQGTSELVRGGVAKLIRAVERVDRKAAQRLREGLEFDYSDLSKRPGCDWSSKAAREQLLVEIATDGQRALTATEKEDDLVSVDAVKEAFDLLSDLIGQDFTVSKDSVPCLRSERQKERILSVHDPEMRCGHKAKNKPFDGYKIHASVTNCEQPVITSICVGKATQRDGHQAPALVDYQPDPIRPKLVLGDTAYGDVQTREELEDRGISVLAPIPQLLRKGRVGKPDFDVNLTENTATCPEGVSVKIPTRLRPSMGDRVARFPASICNKCPQKPRCGPKNAGRQLSVNRREDLLQAGRAMLEDPIQSEKLKKERLRVERFFSMISHNYKARKSRYFGARKSEFQAIQTAVIVNLIPIGRNLQSAKAT